MSEKRCYTVKEIQEILDVSRPTVYALLKKKEFRWIQMEESIEFQKRVLMTGLINSRSKKSGMLVERKSRNRHPNFLFENDV